MYICALCLELPGGPKRNRKVKENTNKWKKILSEKLYADQLFKGAVFKKFIPRNHNMGLICHQNHRDFKYYGEVVQTER